MAESASNMQQTNDVYNLLINNLDEEIEILKENVQQDVLSKSLNDLPLFTIKEIEETCVS